MKVVVDHNICEGNARCEEIAAEVFEVRDDDRAYLLVDPVPGELREKVALAVDRCPRQAIRIVED